ncbi:MAG TPA: hypothetical protein VJ865_12840, partial [Gemmatimonadaceae bacterium]|nr:hypothetical protein [Gemmatimonadaceae bacterium]
EGWSAPLTVSGPGAGAAPTATALLSDLLRTSPPAAARGKHGKVFLATPDSREHRWLVLAPWGTGLAKVFDTHGIVVERNWEEGKANGVITTRIPWSRLQQTLEPYDADFAIARVELSDAEVRLQ